MWRYFDGRALEMPLEQEVRAAVERIRAEGHALRLCIGTDSQIVTGKVHFATAIVFVVVRNGGFMFVHQRRNQPLMSLKERMMTEIAYSIETAYALDALAKELKLEMEIHADINRDPKFPSHASYQEAMGYIKSMGYTFVSKPDAFASSVCADRFCGG